MKAQFGEDGYPQDAATRAAKIRALFIGGTTIAAHTEKCIDSDVWTKHEIRAKATKALRDEVREALGALKTDDGNVPWAGQTTVLEDGAPVWRQEEFWQFDDYVLNYQEYGKRGGSNIRIANNIAKRCKERNDGRGPKYLQIIEVEDEPAH